MDMRVKQIALNPEVSCGRCSSQFSAEGDVPIPGSLRETTNVLYASAMAVVEGTESMQDRISVSGRVIFCVLYTQGDKTRVESIEATADFSHLCDLPGATPQAAVTAFAQAQQVHARVQNGRMTMRTLVKVCARAVGCGTMEALAGIDDANVQTKTMQISCRRTVGRGSGDVLMREEFPLPQDLAITDTLGARAIASFHDTAGGQGRIGLAGEVTIEAIHASSLPGRPLVVTRHTAPVSQSVEISGESGELLEGRIQVKDVAVASQDIGDGERTLRAEVLLGLSAWADREESISVLTDAYTTSGDDLRLTRLPLTLRTGDNRMTAAESGKAALLLPEGSRPVRTMLAAFATPALKDFFQQGSRLIVEGTLDTTLIYLTDDGMPVSARVEAPFRTAFAAEAAPEDIVLLTSSNVEAVPVTSDRVEMRYVLHAQVEGLRTGEAVFATEASAVTGADVPEDMILYFVQPGETVWDIARRYRIPEGSLRALHSDLMGEPGAGQGLVIWRQGVGQR